MRNRIVMEVHIIIITMQDVMINPSIINTMEGHNKKSEYVSYIM